MGGNAVQAKKIGRIAAITLAAALGLWLLAGVLLPVFWPLVIGFGVAALARRPIAALRARTGLSRGLLAFVCVLGVYVLAGLALFFLCRILCTELTGFLRQLPQLAGRLEAPVQALEKRLYAAAETFPDGIGSGLRAGLETIFESGALLGSKIYEGLFQFASDFLGKLPDLVLGAVTAIISSFMIAAEWETICRWCAARIPERTKQKLLDVLGHLSSTLGAWLRAQLKLMGVTFLILTAGFLFLQVEYALLFALLITVIDALPVFGTGTVLIPWSMVQFLQGNTRCGVGFLLLYAAAALTRQALEPRLVGGQIGLSPVVTLAALYAGYRVMGVAGMIVFPLLTVFCCQIYRALPQMELRETGAPDLHTAQPRRAK